MKRCSSLPVASLLQHVLAGDVKNSTCALCLCDDSLLPSAQALTLGLGQNITISDLADEVHIDAVSGDLYSKMVCSACVDKMISFYLFTKQCLRSASMLENLVEVVEQEVTNTSEQFFDMHSKEPRESYAGSSLKINVQLNSFLEQTVQLHCSKCTLDFSTLKKLSLHQKEHIRTPYYLCRICDHTFTGYHIFLSHWASEHNKLPPPIILLQQSKSKTGIKYPGKLKTADSTVCNVCDTLFVNRMDFEEHQCTSKTEKMVTKLGPGELKTSKLQMVKVSKEEINHSQDFVKSNEIVTTNVGLFACGKCSLDFPSIKELSLHLKVHGQGPYNRCTSCDKMFTAYSGLLAHYKTEHPDEQAPVQMKHKRNVKVACSLCGDLFSSRRSLELHIFTKHGASDNHEFCSVCNQIFPNNETHECHVTKRRRNKSRNVARKSADNTEEIAQEGDENNDESQQVKRRKTSSPKKSKKEINQNIEELRNDAGVFECRKCYSDFETIEELSAHQREHGKSPYHHCRVCDKTFNGFVSLVNHCTSVHPERPVPTPVMSQTLNQFNDQFSCNHCNATFRNPSYLRYHMFRRHGETVTEEVCSICQETYFQKHTCRFTCSECPKYPCVHKKYLQAYMNAEEEEPRSRHRCIECDYMYRNRDDLLDHVNRCHLMILPQSCKDCGKKWPSKKALRKHMAISHPVTKETCEYCCVPVPKHLMEQHVDECKLLDKPFSCDLCEGRFASEAIAEVHKKTHVTTRIVCDICCFQCESVEELKRHMLQCRTPLKVVKTLTYPCSKCNLDFPSLEESISHELSHPIDTGYLCRVCNTTFATKAERFECSRTHKDSVTDPCPICGRLFNKLGLKVHMKMHVNKGEIDPTKCDLAPGPGPVKSHMCDVCGSMHLTAYDLKKHYDRHNTKRKCPHCPKLVQRRHIAKHLAMHEYGTKQTRRKLYCKLCSFTTLYRHVFEGHINKVHRRFKPYVCDVCDKKFYSLVYLRSHQGTHVERCLECGECSVKFRSTKGYELHMMQHRGELPHACEHCDLKFVSASRKKEHQDRVHFGPQHQCPLCNRAFYRSSSLKSHVSVVHEGARRRRKIPNVKVRKIMLRKVRLAE